MPEITTRPDRAEIARRVERAEKLLQKGKAAEALEEYLLVLRDDPENDKVRELCGGFVSVAEPGARCGAAARRIV